MSAESTQEEGEAKAAVEEEVLADVELSKNERPQENNSEMFEDLK